MSADIKVQDRGLKVSQLDVHSKDVADFFRSVPKEEYETTLQHVIEVGAFCLERARLSQDTDFFRRQIQGLLNAVETTVERIPEKTQKALLEKIGSRDGQVLSPIKDLIENVSKSTGDRVKEVRTLFEKEIDPGRDSSTLGKTLKSLKELLDPKRSDSIQGSLEGAMKSLTGKEGALSKSIKEVVEKLLSLWRKKSMGSLKKFGEKKPRRKS